jgi:hypothetical protein
MGDAAVRASHERTDAYGYAKTDADGRFRVGPIPPGPYRIDFLRGNRSCKTVGPLEIAVDEERDLGTVRLELPGRLELVLHRANGTAFKPGAGVYLLDEAGYVSTADTRDGAKFVCSSLLPGTYRLECTDESSATEMRPIEIRAGECTRMELTLSAGVLREIQFVIEDGGPRPRKIHLVVHHGQETVIERDCYLDPAATHPSTTQGTYTLLAGFAVGHFEFEAAGEEGLHARGELDVVDLSARDEVVTFKLERRP